jgi:hypothetical protein
VEEAAEEAVSELAQEAPAVEEAAEAVTEEAAPEVPALEDVVEAVTEEAAPEAPVVEGAVAEEVTPEATRPLIVPSTPRVAKTVGALPDDIADDFVAALEHTVLEFSEGDIVEGTVVSIDQNEVLVDAFDPQQRGSGQGRLAGGAHRSSRARQGRR